MTAYINLSTLEYPRHAGDIALDPEGSYAPVVWIDPPEHDVATQAATEGAPETVDGAWQMTWIVRELTSEEIAERDAVRAAARGDVTVSGTTPDVVG